MHRVCIRTAHIYFLPVYRAFSSIHKGSKYTYMGFSSRLLPSLQMAEQRLIPILQQLISLHAVFTSVRSYLCLLFRATMEVFDARCGALGAPAAPFQSHPSSVSGAVQGRGVRVEEAVPEPRWACILERFTVSVCQRLKRLVLKEA